MRSIIIIFIIICSCTYCQKKNVKKESVNTTVENKKAKHLVDRIQSFNKKSPQTIKAWLYVVSVFKTKTYRSSGFMQFNGKRDMMYLRFVDTIFRSPLTILSKNKNNLRIYIPSTKQLFLDSAQTINMTNYTQINLSFSLLFQLATGKIPLLKNYKIKKLKGKYLILENSSFYETLSFKNNIPNKVLFVNKYSKERIEVYLWGLKKIGDTRIYSRIKVVSRSKGVRLNMSINGMKINKPITIYTNFRVPGNVKVQRVY